MINGVPFPPAVQALNASDKPLFIEHFRKEELKNRVPFIVALTYFGGEDVRDLFIETIEADYGGSLFGWEELLPMILLVNGLGFLSANDDFAFSYLLRRWRPDAWSGPTWRDAPELPSQVFLADSTIASLGYSGRNEAREFLESVVAMSRQEMVEHAPAVVNAQFSLDYIDEHGPEAHFMLRLSREAGHVFDNWTLTENGKRWRTWLQEITSGRRD